MTTALPRSTVAGLEAATATAAELCHVLPIHALSSVLYEYDCTHEPADGLRADVFSAFSLAPYMRGGSRLLVPSSGP